MLGEDLEVGGARMNIDEMQAGREMDCLIAEKIFKWEDADWNCEVH